MFVSWLSHFGVINTQKIMLISMACVFLCHSGDINSSYFENGPLLINFNIESYTSRAQAKPEKHPYFFLCQWGRFVSGPLSHWVVALYVLGMEVASGPQFSHVKTCARSCFLFYWPNKIQVPWFWGQVRSLQDSFSGHCLLDVLVFSFSLVWFPEDVFISSGTYFSQLF